MLEPGQIFAGRYRVDRCLAEGGMGAIFEAVHTATERRVALKLLFPHIMSVASALEKFELEAKISARVNSPFIVEVLDAGFDQGTRSPFLVMELLEGHTLAAYVHEHGPLAVDEALPLLEQLAAGLDAAHKYKEGGAPKPIVHRDLKPENLFLSREEDVLVLKILDFGIAKVLGESCNVSQEVRGTPLYMAFEQVTAGPLSPQTDVWAFGLIAYHALTGQHYWRSANDPSANVQSLFAEILTLPLAPPSQRLREQGSRVVLPAAFDAWMLTCLQRDSTRRHASAGAAVEMLARALGRTPRARARFSSMPAPAPALAAPETSPEPTPETSPEPTPRPGVSTPPTPGVSTPPTPAPVAARRVARAETPPVGGPRPASPAPVASVPARASALPPRASALPARAEPSTTSSLPAVASERSATPALGRALATSRSRIAGAAALGVLLVASLLWVAASGRAPLDAGAGAAAPTPGSAHEPTRERSLSLSPTRPNAANEPAPEEPPREPERAADPSAPASADVVPGEPTRADREPAMGANVAAAGAAGAASDVPLTPEPPSPAPPEPRVRVALPEEIAASAAASAAAGPDAIVVAPTEPEPHVAPQHPEPTVAVAPAAPAAAAVVTGDKPPPRRKAYDSKDAYNTR